MHGLIKIYCAFAQKIAVTCQSFQPAIGGCRKNLAVSCRNTGSSWVIDDIRGRVAFPNNTQRFCEEN